MAIYPQYRSYHTSWGINALGTVIVEVESEDGSVGVGEEWSVRERGGEYE